MQIIVIAKWCYTVNTMPKSLTKAIQAGHICALTIKCKTSAHMYNHTHAENKCTHVQPPTRVKQVHTCKITRTPIKKVHTCTTICTPKASVRM